MFIRVTEILLFILIVITVITQIVIPMFIGKKIFPLFRKSREEELRRQLQQAKEDLAESQLQAQVHETERAVLEQKLRNYHDVEQTSEAALSGKLSQNVRPKTGNSQ